jgi:hypothetical protein
LPEKEEVIELTLFESRGIALVLALLMIAQALEGFALPARLLKNSLLLVSEILQAQQFALDVLALLAKGCLAREREAQLRGSGTHTEFLKLAHLHLTDALDDLIEQVPHLGHLLVSGTQAQLLLVLHTLPEMKYRLQCKTKGHGVNLAKP